MVSRLPADNYPQLRWLESRLQGMSLPLQRTERLMLSQQHQLRNVWGWGEL